MKSLMENIIERKLIRIERRLIRLEKTLKLLITINADYHNWRKNEK
jgi:hypothetical protein